MSDECPIVRAESQTGVWTGRPFVVLAASTGLAPARFQMIPRGSPATIAAAAVPRIGPRAGDSPNTEAIIAPAYQKE